MQLATVQQFIFFIAVHSDPCLLVETSVACRLHGGHISQPRGELRNSGDLASLTYSLNWLYTSLSVCM